MALSTNTNIYPSGPTFAISATTTSSQTYVTGPNSISSILVENLDATNDVFISWGQSSTVTATVPSAGASQSGVTVQNGTGKIINIAPVGQTFDSNVTVAANAVSGTATVHITPVF